MKNKGLTMKMLLIIYLKEDKVKIKARTKKKLYILHAVCFTNRWFTSAVMV